MDEAGTRGRVLVVEDEFLISEVVCEALREGGFSVHAVGDAETALSEIAAGRPIDLLFTDINLPGPMDGEALAAAARQLRPDLPVVYASGRWGLLDVLRTMPRSVVLPKPYSLTRACAAVEGLLAAGRPVSAAV